MPITKNGSGTIVETPIQDKDQFERTGVIRDDSFAICDEIDRTKQIKFDASPQAAEGSVTLKAGASSGAVVLTMPTSSGTLLTEAGAANNGFTIFQPVSGTSPTADSNSDTLTLTSSDSTVSIAGNSSTDTLDFKVSGAARLYNVKDYGAVGDGSTDDATAINAANTAAAALAGNAGTVYFPPGVYYVGSTVTFTTHVWGQQAQISTDQNTTAVKVGNGTDYVRDKVILLPKVLYSAKSGLGWSGAAVGVKVTNALHCEIRTQEIKNFVTGLQITAAGTKGNVYNNYHLGMLDTNQTQLLLTPADADGWVNENNFFGGRFHFDPAELQAPSTSTTGQADCRQIYIKAFASDTAHLPNNNVFHKPSLEGDVPQYHVENQGVSNYILYARWESDYPKVRFSSHSATKYSQANQIIYGYDSYKITATEDANAKYNSVITDGVQKINSYGAGDKGIFVLHNPSSSSYPLIVGLKAEAAGAALAVNPVTEYQLSISANDSRYKAKADTYPRIKLDHVNGRVYLGDGTADPADYQDFRSTERWADLTLTHAQILTLNGSPISILAAPGAGYAYMVTGAVAYLNYGGAAYATNTTVNLVPTGSTGLTQATFGNILANTSSVQRAAGPTTSPQINANTGLSVFVSAGNPTAGHADSTLKVRVYYRTVPHPIF
jgi:hypothetical protein